MNRQPEGTRLRSGPFPTAGLALRFAGPALRFAGPSGKLDGWVPLIDACKRHRALEGEKGLAPGKDVCVGRGDSVAGPALAAVGWKVHTGLYLRGALGKGLKWSEGIRWACENQCPLRTGALAHQ